jgi:hypothetical protein
MNENNTNVILEALAETIQRLRVDVYLLKSENERLRKENENLKLDMGNPIERRNNNA